MFTLTVHKLCDTTLFRCAGRLVSGESECLRDAVLAQSHARSVVLDLAEVHSVDAAGLGILLSVREWAQTTGATFKLMNLTPRVEQILELTNLRDVFEFCSVPEMLADGEGLFSNSSQSRFPLPGSICRFQITSG